VARHENFPGIHNEILTEAYNSNQVHETNPFQWPGQIEIFFLAAYRCWATNLILCKRPDLPIPVITTPGCEYPVPHSLPLSPVPGRLGKVK
jgi:hypothetical protein